MQHILNQKEYDSFVSREALERVEVELLKSRQATDTALHYFKSGGECGKNKFNGFCESCPISAINLKKGFQLCKDERYSK